jgi:hypothetical protein
MLGQAYLSVCMAESCLKIKFTTIFEIWAFFLKLKEALKLPNSPWLKKSRMLWHGCWFID